MTTKRLDPAEKARRKAARLALRAADLRERNASPCRPRGVWRARAAQNPKNVKPWDRSSHEVAVIEARRKMSRGLSEMWQEGMALSPEARKRWGRRPDGAPLVVEVDGAW